MKRIITIFVILVFAKAGFSQDKVDPGMASYINISVAPIFELSKMAGQMAGMGGIHVNLSFNNKIYFGPFIQTKMWKVEPDLKSFSPSEAKMFSGSSDLKLNHYQVGLWISGTQSLGTRKNRRGAYVRRKAKLVYGAQIGGGRMFMKDISSNKPVSRRDYYYLFKPMVGIEYPFTRFFLMNVNAGYQIAQKVEFYYENKDYTGPFVNFTCKINLLSRKMGSMYLPGRF